MKKYVFFLLLPFLMGCVRGTTQMPAARPTSMPFNADSAYAFVGKQVAFGPRVPGTDEHRKCMFYLMNELERFGWKVELQEGELNNYANNLQFVFNILARYEVDTSRADGILLCAHYDTRPWADEEEDYEARKLPILGANDGASGVGVILEMARVIPQLPLKRNIYIALFDCEDMGTPSFYTGEQLDDSWCLGSQWWAHTYAENKIQYGILLDMVGDHNAFFGKEYNSIRYASQYVEQIWHNARQLGYGKYFREEYTYPVTDDHLYLNERASIPCVDIIHYNAVISGAGDTDGFPDYWHTQKDNMKNINKKTLEAVGNTVLYTILQ